MADNFDNAHLDQGEQQFIASRAPAHSDEAQGAALDAALGWGKPDQNVPQEAPVPAAVQPAPAAQQAPVPASVPQATGDAPAPEAHPVLDYIHKAIDIGASVMGPAGAAVGQAAADVSAIGQTATNLGKDLLSPQANAGAMDQVSNLINTVKDNNAMPHIANSLDKWAQGKGLDWNTIKNPPTKIDLGGYWAPAPVTPDEHRQRQMGQLVAGFVASSAATAIAPEFGAGKLIAKGVGALTNASVAYATFDPHSHIIGDFIRNNPYLRDGHLEFMQTPANETDSQGRLRNFYEAAGIDGALAVAGALTMGVWKRFARPGVPADVTIPAAPPETTPPIESPPVGGSVEGGPLPIESNAMAGLSAQAHEDFLNSGGINADEKFPTYDPKQAALDHQEHLKSYVGTTFEVEHPNGTSQRITVKEADVPGFKAELKKRGLKIVGIVPRETMLSGAQLSPPGPGETITADAQATAQAAAEPPPVPPGEIPPATPAAPSAPKPTTAAERFVAKAQSYNYVTDTMMAPMTAEEQKVFDKKYYNMTASGIADNSVAQTFARDKAAFDAAKNGKFTFDQLKEMGSKYSPQDVLNYRGDGTDPRYLGMAFQARRYVIRGVGLVEESRLRVLALEAEGKAGTPEFTQAIADYTDGRAKLNEFVGAAKSIGADTARDLGSLRRTVLEKAKADNLELWKDKLDSVFSSEAEAVNTIKQEQSLLNQAKQSPGGVDNFVQHLERVEHDTKYGSVSRAVNNIFLESWLGPATPIKKASSDFFLSGMKPFETAAGAAINKLGGRRLLGNWERNQGTLERFYQKPITNITADEIKSFENWQNAGPTFTRAKLEAQAFFEAGTEQSMNIWNGVKSGKFIGNTDRSVLAIKKTFDALKPEEFDALSWPQKMVYWLSNRLSITKPITNEVTGYFGAIGKLQAQTGMAYDWSRANTKTPEEAALMYEQLMAKPNKPMQQMMMDTAQTQTLVKPLNKGLWKNMIDAMQNPSPVPEGARFAGARRGFNGLKMALAPFANIDVNLTKQAVQRLPFFSLLDSDFRAAVRGGGGQAENAIGKLALGTGIAGLGAKWALDGRLVGEMPVDPTQKRLLRDQGIGPDTFAIGDKRYPLSMLGVPGRILKVAADMVHIGAYATKVGEKDLAEYGLTGFAGAVSAVSPHFITQDITKFLHLVHNPHDVESLNYFNQRTASLLPGGSTFRAVTRMSGIGTDYTKFDTSVDPNSVHPFWDMVKNDFKANIPEFGQEARGGHYGMPPQLGSWGQEMHYASWMGLGPINVDPTVGHNDPKGDYSVEHELQRLGVAGPLFKPELQPGEEHLGITMPSRTILTRGSSAKLSPWQYYDMCKLSAGDYSPLVNAGLMNQAQADKMGENANVREKLKKMISDPGWMNRSDANQKKEIKHTFQVQQTAAKIEMLRMYPNLGVQAATKKATLQHERTTPRSKPVSSNSSAGVPTV